MEGIVRGAHTFVISGASGGLGSYLVKEFSRENRVFGTYYKHMPPEAEENVEYHHVDVRSGDDVSKFAKAIAPRLKNVVLLNLAGVSIDGVGHKVDEESWDMVVDTNLRGTLLMCRHLLPVMREQGWGRIVNISSIVAQVGVPGTGAYSASKSGILGLTRTLAAENASKGITVNALALGYFSIGMIRVLSPEMQELVLQKIPMHRLGDPRCLTAAIRFLIECDYMTGTVLNINGGLH